MTEITDEAIEAAARELCRHGTSFPTIEHTLSWVDEKWPRFTDEASLALYAALPFLSSRSAEAGKPVVKGLEWGLINGWWFAPTAEGQKYIVRASSATNFKGQWLWGLGVETYDLEPSLDAAKAAAQADYERRVISALSTPADIEPVSVPEGWQLVPKRPTEDMLDAALGVHEIRDGEDSEFFAEFRRTYRAMLAAAPQPNPSTVDAVRAQNEWLKDRLAFLQLPARRAHERDQWLIECGMPTALAAQGEKQP